VLTEVSDPVVVAEAVHGAVVEEALLDAACLAGVVVVLPRGGALDELLGVVDAVALGAAAVVVDVRFVGVVEEEGLGFGVGLGAAAAAGGGVLGAAPEPKAKPMTVPGAGS
jgi:hypothetical protein